MIARERDNVQQPTRQLVDQYWSPSSYAIERAISKWTKSKSKRHRVCLINIVPKFRLQKAICPPLPIDTFLLVVIHRPRYAGFWPWAKKFIILIARQEASLYCVFKCGKDVVASVIIPAKRLIGPWGVIVIFENFGCVRGHLKSLVGFCEEGFGSFSVCLSVFRY